MNKTEYLNALKTALKDTDKSVIEEIVSDYEEHFQIGMENGKSEEQICEDLGAIEDLVEEIKEVYHTDQKENKRENKESDENEENNKNNKFKDWYSSIHNLDSEKLGDAINSALDSAGDAISKIDVNEISRTLKSTFDHATTSFNNFADNIKNQGFGPFEGNKRNAEGYQENVSKSYEYEETEETNKNDVSFEAESEAADNNDTEFKTEESDNSDMSFKTGTEESDNSDMSFKAGTEESDDSNMNFHTETEAQDENHQDIKTEASNSEEPTAKPTEDETETKKGTRKGLNLVVDGICADIIVKESADGKLNISYENNGNEKQRQMYEFYSYKEGTTVYAGIRRVGKAVFLFNFNDHSIHINVELPDYMKDINLKTASGNIKLSNATADRIITSTASGDVLSERINTTELRIKGSSGDIRLEEINSNQINAGTMSGDITVNNLSAKFLSLKSSSGDIGAKNIKADVIDCKPTSGHLKMDMVEAGECQIRSTSGDINIHEFTMNNADISSISGTIKIPQIIGDGLRVTSVSGDISAAVNVKRCHASSKSGDVDILCRGDIILESSSTSGNINITLKNYNHGYTVKSKTISGAFYINYDNQHQRNLKTGSYAYGSQGSELDLNSVSGDIHLAD
ncbi:DUF4097 family beta strand repeat-containing protein [Anaerocolumna sp. AGMB13025]|uniref:DUF4097 family beta strand repeat-containing protein n=1 Tax=Anaerocolumna sp. AGMB13025 TaxID=3039116 RepID=UPI00241F0318|nr:DUF4097 family beta strand repeat-containing protein [Anaerocolumna sp. AGMB13025]WFR59030.1 DUF4097 family beta strand repeat-containing protein [Anaerocolumna sp. AGMB13025]